MIIRLFKDIQARLTLILLIIALYGCSCNNLPPPDPIDTPDYWKTEHEDNNLQMPDCGAWWEVFDDPQLNWLEELALSYNLDAQTALAKVMEARGFAMAIGAPLYPQLTLQPTFTNTGTLFRSFAASAAAPTASTAATAVRFRQRDYTFPFDLNYEIDIWGQIRTGYKAALYDVVTADENYNLSLLTLTADVAQNYYQLRSLDSQIDVLIETREVRQDGYEVNQARFEAGLVTYLDVAQAKLLLADAEAEIAETTRQRAIIENIISLLCGQVSTFFSIPHSEMQKNPPNIPADLPSDVLRRRPDVAASESTLAASSARVYVQEAYWLPSVNLTGTLGYNNPIALSQLFDWQSRLWSYTTSIFQTLFDGGHILGNVDAAKAVFIEDLCSYENTVLTAFKDVEDSLINIKLQDERKKALHEAVLASKDALDLSQDRYNHGLITYLEVVDSQRSLLDNRRTEIQANADRFISTVGLVKAMGGGWDDGSGYGLRPAYCPIREPESIY